MRELRNEEMTAVSGGEDGTLTLPTVTVTATRGSSSSNTSFGLIGLGFGGLAGGLVGGAADFFGGGGSIGIDFGSFDIDVPPCGNDMSETICQLPEGNFVTQHGVIGETTMTGPTVDTAGVFIDLGIITIGSVSGLGIGVLAAPGAVGVTGAGAFTTGEIVGAGALVGGSAVNTFDELHVPR